MYETLSARVIDHTGEMKRILGQGRKTQTHRSRSYVKSTPYTLPSMQEQHRPETGAQQKGNQTGQALLPQLWQDAKRFLQCLACRHYGFRCYRMRNLFSPRTSVDTDSTSESKDHLPYQHDPCHRLARNGQ
jgi:hypothetical protein